MKFLLVLFTAAISLTGCIEFDDITHPSTGTVHQAFDVQLALSSGTNTCSTGGDCIAEVAVTIPVSWQVEQCTFQIEAATEAQNCNVTPASLNSANLTLHPITNDYQRLGFNATFNSQGQINTTAVMQLSIIPRSSGTFALNYIGSAEAFNLLSRSREWYSGERSDDYEITISPVKSSVVPVPSMGTIALGLLSLALVILASSRRRFSGGSFLNRAR